MSARRALVTGAGGQDGGYLCEQLLHKEYMVHAMVRDRARGEAAIGSLSSTYPDHFHLVLGDLNDHASLSLVLENANPDEIYHLGGLSSIPQANAMPDSVLQTNMLGTCRLLELAWERSTDARIFVANSAEIFGNPDECPQTLLTPLAPRNAYGLAKLAAYHAVEMARRRGQYAVSGVLYPHESPRRPASFVTRKVTMAAARIKLGLQEKLLLGSLDVSRDWGYAPEYTDCMWKMLQHSEPWDQIIATGQLHSLRDLCWFAFYQLGLNYEEYVVHSPRLDRPEKGLPHQGDPTRAWEELQWKANREFREVIREMAYHDYRLLGGEQSSG